MTQEPLSERALAVGMGMACLEDDEEWMWRLINASPYAGGIADEFLAVLIDIVLGRSTTEAEAREAALGGPTRDAGQTLQ